jgi:hypothetical protein
MDSPLSSISFEVETDVVLSTENTTPIPTPAPTIPIPIPPATADDIVRQALERESLSPQSAYAALEAHGSELSPEVALLFAKKIAEAAIDKADRSAQRIKFLMRTNDKALRAQQVAITSADETIDAMQRRINNLEDQCKDFIMEQARTPAPYRDNGQECPDGFEENAGLIPDFWVHSDGIKLLARYVKRIPGTGLAHGTLGGPNDIIHTHELQALPSIACNTTPDIIPAWFLQCISANATPFPLVMDEVRKYGDWGLEAEVERYHNTDVELVELQATMHEVQAAIDSRTIQKHACHYRLARSDVGECLASLQALSSTYQEGNHEGFISSRRFIGRGRPTA